MFNWVENMPLICIKKWSENGLALSRQFMQELTTLQKLTTNGRIFYFIFFFYLGFLSLTLTIHSTAGEREGYFATSPLRLPLASQTLRH